MQEAIKLIYGDRDILYVSIHALHKISKYNGKEGAEPKLYKLGSPAWKAVKEKTKARVKKIAFDLIQTYAKRKLKKGFQYGPDSYLQYELEASFLYEDTPDQIKATADVKQDMESERPMDRLICGDVGFGKTEVAIRAAFKAADNGKQVAVLVPTTILAYQHYKSFSQRMADLPIEVEYLNRFRSAKEKKDILERLERGQIDVLIGTHLIVGAQIKYKDLGLLIVDEEQKFGVSVKDKLKSLKENIDVLTLTATPIPRTLQFSLMAARDLSVIQTPPPNRYPIESELIRFDEAKIRDAIAYEISRGGQVFFIHNRIENIKEVAGMIQRLVPDARITIAHGQMEGHQLEEQMIAFMQGDYDVLVSTSIIESGLDVSNANTMLINNAQNFGLSDLHQMRGRVGRSNKKAFCYFITPPEIAMTEVARKRLEALTQFTALGSGFHIAMKDLEIRGAGDLLGGEQSGFINDIGFDTYQKIMQEAIEELKENSFAELFKDEPKTKKNWGISEIQIDTDLELRFTEDYINSTTERLSMYSALAALEGIDELKSFENQLVDRFGPLPKVAKALLDSVALKIKVMPLGVEKIVLKQGKMWCYFVGDPQSPFYQSEQFQGLLQLVAARPNLCIFKEKDTRNGKRLMLVFDGVKTAAKAYSALEQLLAIAP
jgi:transcription-repair coupling factor (superfamily II helicase)